MGFLQRNQIIFQKSRPLFLINFFREYQQAKSELSRRFLFCYLCIKILYFLTQHIDTEYHIRAQDIEIIYLQAPKKAS